MKTPLLVALALSVASSAEAGEWVVDLAGRGDVLSIQAAVDLAVDGDVIVVRPGTYTEDVTVQGKGVWIVAQQGGGLVGVEGGVELIGIPAGTQVVLRELTVEPALPDALPLRVVACEATVTLVGCTFRASDGPAFGFPLRSALQLDGASRVNSVNCTYVGARAFTAGPVGVVPGGDPGMVLVNSRLALWGGQVVGAEGITATSSGPFVAGSGGVGVLAMGSEVFLSGALVRGGAGGQDDDFIGAGGGAGGAGVEVDAASRILAIETMVAGGPGGVSFAGPTGAAGPERLGAGPLFHLRGAGELHGAGAFALNQSSLDVAFAGTPRRTVDLYLTTDVPPFLLDRGALWTYVRSNAPTASFGPIPASGQLQGTVPIPQLPTSPATITATFIAHVNRGGRGGLLGPPIPVVGVNCQAFGTDCDGSGRSDLCEIVEGSRPDLDGNGQIDGCDADCNGNGVPDGLDVQSGTSADVNGNGVPDECEAGGTAWYVSPTALPGGDGSLGAPYRILFEALDSALDGHEIVLLDGVHQAGGNTNLDLGARSVTIRSQNGAGSCTLDLGPQAVALRSEDGSATGPLTVDGIRFVYGRASGFGAGVIHTRFRDVVVRDCVFESGAADASGGALVIRAGSAVVEGCSFIGPGGGAFDDEAAVILENGPGVHLVDRCRFEGHRSVRGGASLDVRSDHAFVTRCRFLGAESLSYGGAVRSSSGAGRFDQCLFAGNVAGVGGGAMWLISSGSAVSSCTFADNRAPVSGSLQVAALCDVQVSNSVFSGTGPQVEVSSIAVTGSNVGSALSLDHVTLTAPVLVDGTPTVVQSMVDVADPLFALPAGPDGDPATLDDNDYRLGAGSPCIDAGSNGLIAPDVSDADGDLDVAEPMPVDLAGAARRLDDPAVSDTGSGPSPVVDIGCFERQP